MLKSVAIEIFQNYLAKQIKIAKFPESLKIFYSADAKCAIFTADMMRL